MIARLVRWLKRWAAPPHPKPDPENDVAAYI
jgi:hypothetical protein